MRAFWVVGLVVAIGCKMAGPAREAKPPAPAAPVAPAAPDERDLLWALAPEGATLGIVVSARGVAMIERAATTAQEVLSSSADFATIQGEVMHGLMRALGTPNPTLAGFGLSHDRGFATFVADDGQVVMVLPVGDRDRFVAALQGSKGTDGDVVGSWACQTTGGRYVCAQRRGLFAKLGRSGLDALRRSAAGRGEIEVAGRGVLGPLGRSFAAVAELDRGTVIVRGTVEGAAPLVTDALGAPGTPRTDAAGAAGFGVVDLTPVMAALRPLPIAPGVTTTDLARTVAGPVTYVVGAGTDDILAAAEHLANRPDVDPARIYLGGHSTGGTLALLAAASTDRFRAVFAFGPVSDPRNYGSSGCLPGGKPEAEYAARAPVHWIGSIVSPTLVIEGEHSGNVEDFPALQMQASPVVKFAAIAGADHFSVLAPAAEALARAIAADTGPQVSITLDTAAIARGVETSH